MNTGFVVLSRDPLVRGEVVNAGATASQLYLVARDADELIATIEASHPRAIVVDREYGEADHVLTRLREVSGGPDGEIVRGDATVFLVIRDTAHDLPSGAHVVD